MGEHSTVLAAVSGIALTFLAVLWVILLVRVVGLRSLSKMTGFDFVTTIAVGSLIATAGTAATVSEMTGAMSAILALFLLQWLLAKWRVHSKLGRTLLGNEPVLLMEEGRFIDGALEEARVTRADIYAKMREAGVLEIASVRAVVLERTGDISVIKEGSLDSEVMTGVGGLRQQEENSGGRGSG